MSTKRPYDVLIRQDYALTPFGLRLQTAAKPFPFLGEQI